MRRLVLLVAALMLLTGCGAKHLVVAPRPSNIDVATPDMVAMKAKSQIQDCPKPEVARGVLPAKTVRCLGGGTSVDLATLKGPLIINFWGSACKPCAREMPALAAFYRQYGDQVQLLGIDSNDTYPGVALRKAIKWGVTYPLLADPGGDLQGSKLSVRAYPWFYFLSADGKLTYQIGGFTSVDEIKAAVDKHLGLHL